MYFVLHLFANRLNFSSTRLLLHVHICKNNKKSTVLLVVVLLYVIAFSKRTIRNFT